MLPAAAVDNPPHNKIVLGSVMSSIVSVTIVSGSITNHPSLLSAHALIDICRQTKRVNTKHVHVEDLKACIVYFSNVLCYNYVGKLNTPSQVSPLSANLYPLEQLHSYDPGTFVHKC